MAGLQYNFFPTDLLYPKSSSSSSSSEAIDRASVTFKTPLNANKVEDHQADHDQPKTLIIQNTHRSISPLILNKLQINNLQQLSKDSTHHHE